jgi:hypothetical protein
MGSLEKSFQHVLFPPSERSKNNIRCLVCKQMVAVDFSFLRLAVGTPLNLSLVLSTPRLVLKLWSEPV